MFVRGRYGSGQRARHNLGADYDEIRRQPLYILEWAVNMASCNPRGPNSNERHG
jgi:hypothetical protein